MKIFKVTRSLNSRKKFGEVWYTRCNPMDFDITRPVYVTIREIDDTDFENWKKYGKFTWNNINTTTGVDGRYVSISPMNELTYLRGGETAVITTYNELVMICLRHNIEVDNFSYVTEEMRGWYR